MAAKQEFLPTCDPSLTPIVAGTSHPFIERRAIDTFGRVALLYNAHTDEVLYNSDIIFATQLSYSRRLPECFMKQCHADEHADLLKWCNINDAQRLSVTLELSPGKGIAKLVNYSRPIDEYTRFVVYNYYGWTEYLSDDKLKSLHGTISRMLHTRATHMIVLVNWGIDAVVVLQLPSDDKHTEAIDSVLQKICFSLKDENTNGTFTEEEKSILKKILHTKVFSNITSLTAIDSIIDFHRRFSLLKFDRDLLKPYNYNLCAVEYFYASSIVKQGVYIELQKDDALKIESYLLQLSLDFKRLTTAMNQDYSNLQKHQKIELNEIRKTWRELEEMYSNEIYRIRNLVDRVRHGGINQSIIPDVTNNDQATNLTKMIQSFSDHVNAVDKKERFIKDLLDKRFVYENAINRGIENGDDQETLERKLLTDPKNRRIMCSDDNLYKENQSQWHILCGQLLKERNQNPQLQLIYVDFTYCLYKLNDIIILPTTENNNNVIVPRARTTSPPQRLENNKSINILLLGESGVGKSTFINAFVNYLKFDKLKEAEKKPIILIPVSFIMTTDDNFTERLIKFEGNDTLSNEDHDHLGQSVTQHCKSYVFTLRDGESRGQKLRIIDTPGIGDTHGSGQDDVNLQHILSYITNLTHLNAICILLKPNNVRLNIFFRSCFTQLIDLLGENACDRIMFCFTNSRSTFYTPGNTAPALKALLQSLTVKKILFAKQNTFCFDSESFRYLVARLNKIDFKDIEEKEYNDSWKKSSSESNRLLKYIRTNMSEGIIPNASHSLKYTQLKINLMIRPMLEAMRNILRNIILWNAGSRKFSIELCPRIIKGTTAICLKCPREYFQVADFWITMDCLHVFHNKCRTCQCDPSAHYPIDYELGYKRCDCLPSTSEKDMTRMLDDLCQKSAEFADFLLGPADALQIDPFFVGLNRMIKEEDNICATKSSYELNSTLIQMLEKLKNIYGSTRKKMASKKECIKLDNIDEKVENVSRYEMIKVQMAAVRQWHEFMIKYYEHEVLI